MDSEFLRCDVVTSGWEGGDVDDPDDPGGRTSRGVTQGVYDEFRDAHRLPRRDVFLMTEDERLLIYWSRFWRPVRGSDLPRGVNLSVYDAGVNSGPGRAAKWLQQGINDLAGSVRVMVDSAVGPQTVAGARGVPAADLVSAVCARRMSFVTGLGVFWKYGRGWTRRIADIEARGVAWAVEGMASGLSLLRGRREDAEKQAAGKDKAAASVGIGGSGTTALGVDQVPAPVVLFVVVLVVLGVAALVIRGKGQRDRAAAFDRVISEMEG